MLKFDSVTKVYNEEQKAVENFTLEIEEGEFIVIIGPSGCGKTTLLKMINRLIEPTNGNIYIKDENILDEDLVELRRSIGYVIQQIGLFPHMSIQENISLVPKLLKWPVNKQRDRAEELLRLVNMDLKFMDRYPHEMSGGQQQRIGVLRALASDPSLILMDEPFGALDPVTREHLQQEFKNLQQSIGKTIVFVTHDIDEALKLADRIVIMNSGKVVQVGTPNEILRNPADEFVKEFIGKELLLQSKPKIVTVEQVMSANVVTITEDESLFDAIKLMEQQNTESLFVIDEQKVLKGTINFEVIIQHSEEARTVSDFMEFVTHSVEEGTFIRDMIHQTLNSGVKKVPVIDEKSHLQGVIIRDNLVDIVCDSIFSGEDHAFVKNK